MTSYYTGYGTSDNPNPKDIIGAIFGTILIIVLSAMVSSCKVQSIPQSHENDSVRIEYRLDSVYLYERDSIFVDRYVKADTVFLTRTIERVKYKDAIRLQHDTITTTKTDVIVQTERYIPQFYKGSTIALWVLIAAIVVYVVVRILKAIYLRR